MVLTFPISFSDRWNYRLMAITAVTPADGNVLTYYANDTDGASCVVNKTTANGYAVSWLAIGY